MNDLSTILDHLEHQDLRQILKHGMPADTQEKVTILCERYKAAAPAEKAALKKA